MTDVARGWTSKDALVTPAVPLRPAPQEGGLWRRTVAAMRTALAAVPRPNLKQPYYPPVRERFVEDAAMSREMWRL